jgi:hypothetical protein
MVEGISMAMLQIHGTNPTQTGESSTQQAIPASTYGFVFITTMVSLKSTASGTLLTRPPGPWKYTLDQRLQAIDLN